METRAPRRSSLPGLSIVVPAHNELENIEPITAELRLVCEELFGIGSEKYEIILVNDGSVDGTDVRADALARAADVQVVHHQSNRGYGAALRSGFEVASQPFVAFIDGDRQLEPRDLLRLAQHADANTLSIGYREKRDDPLYRKLLGKIFSRIFVPLFIGVRVQDVDCALKIIPREVIRIADLSANGALINSELLAIANAEGYEICETPVSHYPRSWGEQSGAKLSVIFKVFQELMSVRRRLRCHMLKNPNTTPGVVGSW